MRGNELLQISNSIFGAADMHGYPYFNIIAIRLSPGKWIKINKGDNIRGRYKQDTLMEMYRSLFQDLNKGRKFLKAVQIGLSTDPTLLR